MHALTCAVVRFRRTTNLQREGWRSACSIFSPLRRGEPPNPGVRYEQPLVVPQLEQTKQAPARCMTMPHW
jgi:hypothetical protein